jgi:hypothetical protein
MSGGRPTDHYPVPENLINAADRSLRRVSATIDARSASLERHIKALDDPSAKTPIAAEIRSHVKSLKKPAKLMFLQKAIEEGDKRTVAAVLAGPAYLSGLDTEMHNTIHAMAADKFAPVDHAQLKVAKSVLTQVQNAGSKVFGRYTKVLEQKDGPAMKASKALSALGYF